MLLVSPDGRNANLIVDWRPSAVRRSDKYRARSSGQIDGNNVSPVCR